MDNSISFKMFSIATSQVLLDMFTNSPDVESLQSIKDIILSHIRENDTNVNTIDNLDSFVYKIFNLEYFVDLRDHNNILISVYFLDDHNTKIFEKEIAIFKQDGMTLYENKLIKVTETRKETTMEDITSIPNIDEDINNNKGKEEQKEDVVTTETSKNNVSIDKFNRVQYLQMFFGNHTKNYFGVLDIIKDEDNLSTNGIQWTGTAPVETFIEYDDYTFSIISMNNAKVFNIYVCVTTDGKHWIDSHLDTRWLLVAEIRRDSCVIDNAQFNIPRKLF